MNKFESLKRCYHCGAVIQMDDPNKEGYLDPKMAKSFAGKEVFLCDSCYKKQRFNRLPAKMQTSEGFLTMMKDAKASDAMIVDIIDLTSFECSFDLKAIELAKGLNYIIIGNKRDLIPSEYKDDDLKEYIVNVYKEYGINLKKDDIFLSSLLSSSFDISSTVKEISKRRKGHDVYIVGDLSSGKSLFFNAFLRNYKNPSNHSVGVSRYYGTDLDVLKIPLDSISFIYDTPGNIDSNSFARYREDSSFYRFISTNKPYIGRKIAISPKGSVFISTAARIDYLEGKKRFTINAHFPEKVQVKGITPKKSMDELFLKYHEKKALKPHPAFVSSLADYDIFDIAIDGKNEYQEITFSGLGWISFKTLEDIKLRIYVPKGIGIYAGKAKGLN